MKKLKKVDLNALVLTSNELKQLKGGATNENIFYGCSCTFYNGPRTINNNISLGCKCTCSY